ncbi:MAG: DNA polymerase/3'-5' exonuclease PolX [Candidatus Pacebacteria bacterium]|nr:DNA polymerase/3'-5' exonuclease PolX [Candidatus Paceibacterota bacterium]MDD5555544.1 DNA polymerase/3'-5' exonuclease PolX [Candidatus Paceibacterota bacterium]
MKNQELAQLLFEIGEFLELQEIPFKPQAYQQAALALDNLEEDVFDIYKKDGLKGLKNIPAVGESIALKIEEYLKTGKIKYYEQLRKSTPVEVDELTKIEGLGGKRIKRLYKELGVRTVKDLERAIAEHQVASLFGFGEKMEKNIAEAIEFLKKSKGRFLLKEVLDDIERIEDKFRKMKGVEKVSVAGSIRRRKETIGDADFLVSVNDVTDKYLVEKIMKAFVSMEGVVKIVSKGETRSSVKTRQGLDMDLRLVPSSSFGSALQYFTGSKEHNIALRKIAIKQGYKLNEYGLFRKERKIKGETEEEIYEKLGMDWMPPEIRENAGEIEAARERKLPELIELKNIKGDFHCHSDWDGGSNSIEDMVKQAKGLGYEYLGISDHTQFLRIENGLDEKRLMEQNRYIKKLNEKLTGFKVLHGAEVNILNDGSLDIDEETLKKLDYVSVGIHSNFKMPEKEMTERIIRAMKKPYVNILNHPTGRILQRREGFNVDLEKIFKAARQYNVILEINSSERADLSAEHAKRAKEYGVKLVIGTDSHDKHQMPNMKFGVYQARRGWLEKSDVINTYSFKELKDYFTFLKS